MALPEISEHEANFDYVIKNNLDHIIKHNKEFEGLHVSLQPQVPAGGRADVIVKDGMKPLIVFETKKDKREVQSLNVHRKARQYALNLKAKYFVVSNLRRTYLFKNDMGPLRELQINLWESRSPMNIQIVLDEILKLSLNERWISSRMETFLERYKLLLKDVKIAYTSILHGGGKLVRDMLNRAESRILTYMGIEIDGRDIKKREKSINNLATQAAYILLNKVFCYEVIRCQFLKQFNKEIPMLWTDGSSVSIKAQMDFAFQHLIEEYDFAPIFQSDEFFSKIPFSEELDDLIINFLEELSEFDLENLEGDFIGKMYQELIPLKEKKGLGQIYTPENIAKLMVNLSIENFNSVVLDPACGCGTFLREIYLRERNLLLEEKKSISGFKLHQKLLEQIWGVEINNFPAHLSMMTLTFMNLSSFSDLVGVLLHDFLDMGPMEKYNVKTKNLRTGDVMTREMPKKFDVVIANPPYVKQEIIPNKKRMMKRLPEYASYRMYLSEHESQLQDEISGNLKKSIEKRKIPKVKMPLSGRTDYYGFFLWYSTYFLKLHGTLCFIIPNKWLDVKYGEKLKKFILNHYKIRAIIGFNKNVFPKAQVSTIIVLLQKESKKIEREENIARFFMIGDESYRSRIKSLVDSEIPSKLVKKVISEGYQFSNPARKVQQTLLMQKDLKTKEKWSIKYLYQSKFLWELNQIENMVPMDNQEVTSVLSGIKTGANPFFYPSESLLEEFAIESKFLKPGIKSGRNIPPNTIVDFPVMYFVSVSPNTRVENFPQLKAYLKHGKEKGYPKRPSMRWKPWYSIPIESQDCPDILFLRHIDSNFTAHLNEIKSIVADGVRGIKVHREEDIWFYLGVLNSTFFYWQAHIRGRWEGQGDLQLLVYELRRFLLPDTRKISFEKKDAVAQAMKDLLSKERDLLKRAKTKVLSKKKLKRLLERDIDDRENLDRAVLNAMDLSDSYDLLVHETQFFETLRLNKSL